MSEWQVVVRGAGTRVARRRWLPLALLPSLLATACIGGPNPTLAARPTPDPAGVAGTYCHRSPAVNVREAATLATQRYWQEQERRQPGTLHSVTTGGFGGLPVRDFADSTRVEVRVEERGTLVMRWLDRTTRRPRDELFLIAGPTTGGELRLEDPARGGGGAAFGVGRASRWLTVTRGTDGRLTMIRWYRERGLFLLLVPFQEYYMKTVDLDPASACG